MSEMMMLGIAGTFGGALALFVLTSAVAAPFYVYEEVRARRRRR